MPNLTPAQRSQRYRDRKAGKLPAHQPLTCASCGANHLGEHDPLCCRCWERLTPEGRAANADRVRRYRDRRRAV